MPRCKFHATVSGPIGTVMSRNASAVRFTIALCVHHIERDHHFIAKT